MKLKRTMSVNVDNIDEDLRPLCKDEMNMQEIGTLGMVVLKMKISKFRERLRRKKRS